MMLFFSCQQENRLPSKNKHTNSPTHILNDAHDWYASLPAESDFFPHILDGHFLRCCHQNGRALWHAAQVLHHCYMFIGST